MVAETGAGLILGFTGFAATNIDNSVVLISIFGAKRESTNVVSLGFATGSMLMLAIALTLSFVGELIPVRYLGYLGVIPILVGVLELTRSTSVARRASSATDRGLRGASATLATVSILTLAGGTDTLAVIAPLLAESKIASVWAMCAGYVIAAMGMAALIGYATRHPAIAEPLQRYGTKIGPGVMIAIGLYILVNTATDRLQG
jgi:cadmium resistance protein CadD (predicted permease)